MSELVESHACLSQYMAYTFVYFHIKEISTAWGLVSFLKLRPVILAVRKLTSQGHLGVQLLGPRTPWTKISSAGRSLWTPNIHYHLSLSSWMKILPTKSPSTKNRVSKGEGNLKGCHPRLLPRDVQRGKSPKRVPQRPRLQRLQSRRYPKLQGRGQPGEWEREEWGEAAKKKTRGCAAHPSLELPRQLHPRQRPPCQRPHHAQAHPREHAGQSNLALRHLSLPALRHLSFPAAIRNSQSSAFRMTQWKPQPIAHTMLSTAQPTVGHRQPSAQSLSVRIRESMPRGYSVCTTRFHQVCQGFPGSPGIKRTMSLRANLILVDNPKWVCKTNSAWAWHFDSQTRMLFFACSPWHNFCRFLSCISWYLIIWLFCVVLVGALYPHIQSVGECPSPMIPSQHQHVGTRVRLPIVALWCSFGKLMQIGKLGFDLTCAQVQNVGSCVTEHLRHAKGGQK